MNMTKIAVTGGSGKAGRAVVRDLLERGHDVINLDTALAGDSYRDQPAPYLPVDVTDYGQVFEALAGGEGLPKIEAVVHFAAIPSPDHHVPDQVFRTNMASTYAVFSAAARLGLQRVVWASSETTLGLPFDRPPDYAPSMRSTCTRRPVTRSPRCWARRWRVSFTAGAGFRSSACATPT